MRVRFLCIAFLFACALSLVLPIAAQTPNGTVNGLVLDPSNKVIGGADILVINDATGVQYSGKTNEDGIYVVSNLPPGAYRLQISKVGFKTLIKPDIVLNIQDALSINFTLPVGAIFETVTVEGGASMINTTNASVSTVVDQTFVKNMPLNGRSFQDLILLTPGIVPQSPQNTGTLGMTGEFSVNGQRTESNNYTVDGVSANVGSAAGQNMILGAGASGSVAASTALGTTQALVSVDDLQEFRVQSSTYSAEYGRNPGGQFAFETKSGANQWNGTAYDYLRNGFFDAQDWFNDYLGVRQPALRQNDFGGTVGGPVRIPSLYNGKDKTFFFVSYEGLRLTSPQAASVNLVPDLCLRGVTSSCEGTNAPAAAALQPALNAIPLPTANGLDFGDGIAQYIGSWSNPSSLDSTSVRFDHVVKGQMKLFFRFSDTSSTSAIRGTYANFSTPSVNGISSYTLRTYTGGITGLVSTHISNDVRLNYSSNEAAGSQVIDAFGGSTPVNLAQLSGLSPESVIGIYLCYDGCFQLSQLRNSGAQRQWNLVDTISLSLGRHEFKFGADYRRLAPFATPFNPSVSYLYFSESEVESNSGSANVGKLAPAFPLYANYSAFAQDEWRAWRRLSLSLGLRWEINPPPGVTRGLMPYTVQGADPATWKLATQRTPLWQTTWYNFAPRLGVAYVIRNAPGWETVFRGGGGVFFDTGQSQGSGGFAGPGFNSITSGLATFPGLPTGGIPGIVNPPVAPYPAPAVGFASHLQLPYTLQWNVSTEQALGKSQALTLSYVGAHAARLLQTNQFSPANNPNTTNGFFIVSNGLTSNYDTLQVQFRRRLSRGLTALASYTWSHCLDYGSQNLSFGYRGGNCDFDVRHNLTAAFSYDLPNLGRNKFVNTLLRDWGLDDRFTVRTAFPVLLEGSRIPQPDGQIYDAGLSFVPGQPILLHGANCASVLQGLGDLQPGQGCPGGRAINPQAFTNVSSGYGNTPRNFARGFGAWQMDLGIRRDFPIHQAFRLQFRAEAFNIFNHPNFGKIDGIFGEPNFGQVTSTLANSLGILSPLYQMGGPRAMQFALKLTF